MSAEPLPPAAEGAQIPADLHTTTSPDDWKLRAEHDERFYSKGAPEVPELAIEILSKYSKIPDNEILDHVMALRDRAYAIHPYPCIGRFRFLKFSLEAHPLFESHVVPLLLQTTSGDVAQAQTASTLKSPPLPAPTPSPAEPVFLDIGTCLGQDLRLLLYKGVAPSRVFATDIEPDFLPLGFELFRDAATFPTGHQLAPVDLFSDALFADTAAPTSPAVVPAGILAPFAARVDVLHISAVFHLFSYNDQVVVGRRVLGMMRPPAPLKGARSPAVILGHQTAHATGKAYPQRVNGKGEMLYRHSAETWEHMWTTDVAPGGVVTYPGGEKAKLRFNTFLGEITGNLPGLAGAVNDSGGPRDDLFFKWMRFEIWLDPIE